MDGSQLVAYCGLHCGLCAQRARVPRQAQTLRDTMEAEGYEFWGQEVPGFSTFWDFLNGLCEPDHACPGCREGGGYPGCEIRICAHERGVEICPSCERFPCEHIKKVNRVYPTLVADGRRLREIGLDAWCAEQDARLAKGFCYADIRHRR